MAFDNAGIAAHRGATMIQIHANCVALGDDAILLRGPSGSGKSSLSLRLIEQGAFLVADDRSDLENHAGQLHATAPAPISRLCEVRGIGIVRGLPWRETGRVRVVFDLVGDDECPERMPDPMDVDLCGVVVPCWKIMPSDPAVTMRIKVALAIATGEMQLVK